MLEMIVSQAPAVGEGPSANEIAGLSIALRAFVSCVGLVVLARDAERKTGAGAGEALRAFLPFVLLVGAVVTEKVVGLVFYLDLPVIVALFAGYLLWTRRLGVRNSVYLGIVTFLCADFCVALANSVYLHAPAFSGPLAILGIELGYALALVGLCALLRRWAPVRREARPPTRGFVALLLALLPYIVLRSSSAFYSASGQLGVTMEVLLALCIVATFGAVAGNYSALLAEAERGRRLALEVEMRERERHGRERRATVEEINRRYHDLVKYARMCEHAQAAGDGSGSLLARITADLDTGTLLRTGNETLDMILWTADDACRAHGLRLAPAIDLDVRLLGFVDPFDLHAILGNALDNAVEAASLLPEGDVERREVGLRLAQVGRMAFIRVSNHVARGHEPREEGGRLRTRKDNPELHGFGLENIRRAAQAYGGWVRYDVDGDMFALTVMLPLGD